MRYINVHFTYLLTYFVNRGARLGWFGRSGLQPLLVSRVTGGTCDEQGLKTPFCVPTDELL